MLVKFAVLKDKSLSVSWPSENILISLWVRLMKRGQPSTHETKTEISSNSSTPTFSKKDIPLK